VKTGGHTGVFLDDGIEPVPLLKAVTRRAAAAFK